MRTFAKIVGVIALIIGGGYVWWQFTYPTYTYRYRITLEVDVDGAIKAGSSVIEVTRRWDPVPGRPISHYSTAAKGEAVYVDLGRAGNLFLLLTDEGRKNPQQLGAQAFHFDPTDNIDAIEQRRRATELTAKRATAELRSDQLPPLLSFTNLNDPNTARVVKANEFEQVFGPGVRFKRAWLEMTADPRTLGIEQKLPWWNAALPWLKPMGNEVYVDTRRDGFIWRKEMFKKEF